MQLFCKRPTFPQPAICRRGKSEVGFESVGEMALVGEPCRQRDVAQRSLAGDELFGGELYSEAPAVFADGATMFSSEYATQVDWMYSGAVREIVDCERKHKVRPDES